MSCWIDWHCYVEVACHVAVAIIAFEARNIARKMTWPRPQHPTAQVCYNCRGGKSQTTCAGVHTSWPQKSPVAPLLLSKPAPIQVSVLISTRRAVKKATSSSYLPLHSLLASCTNPSPTLNVSQIIRSRIQLPCSN